MSIEHWSAVDEYINEHIVPSDSVLDHALAATQAADIPSINVAPNQGKLLQLMARMMGASKILEIGTLGGYSTIWLARALPAGGQLVTLEYSPKHAETAEANIKEAALDGLVTILVGAAIDTLPTLVSEGAGPFDFIFIDADKVNNAKYLDWALKLSRVGTVIVCDNVVRDGRIVDPEADTPDVVGTREFFTALGAESCVTATAVQTVGAKGYDGFAVALVTS